MEEDPQTVRLFLANDTAVYDFASPDSECRDNIRQALAQDAQIEDYLQLTACFCGSGQRSDATEKPRKAGR